MPSRCLPPRLAKRNGARVLKGKGQSLLVSERMSVVLAARRAGRLEEIVGSITDEGGTAVTRFSDTTSADDLKTMVDRAVEEFGHLDFAVNSACTPGRVPFLDLTMEQFDDVMNVNVRGVVVAMRAEITAMLTNGGGAIVNVASVAGLVGGSRTGRLRASKHAAGGLTESVGLEYAAKGIRFNPVAPR